MRFLQNSPGNMQGLLYTREASLWGTPVERRVEVPEPRPKSCEKLLVIACDKSWERRAVRGFLQQQARNSFWECERVALMAGSTARALLLAITTLALTPLLRHNGLARQLLSG